MSFIYFWIFDYADDYKVGNRSHVGKQLKSRLAEIFLVPFCPCYHILMFYDAKIEFSICFANILNRFFLFF